MELFSAQFFSALVAIVIIDLVLAGDNAIVIALAARNVPRHLQKRAILWGALGAIAVRSSFTIAVVGLLRIPGLLFTGGALLIWIAYRLLLPEESGDNDGKVGATSGFWAAIRTIVVADMVMGLDNVLGVAGAAQGSFLLVVLGLLISVPIVIWGSAIIMRFIERFPVFVYVGAGVLAWTAAKMMASEPLFAEFYADHKLVAPLMYFVVIVGVLWAGFVKNHRRLESRISARLAHLLRREGATSLDRDFSKGGRAMSKVLVPVDDSPNAQHAARHVINQFLKNPQLEVHLLNVQPPFSRHIGRFVSKKNRTDFHRDEGEKALAPVKRLLDGFGVPYTPHIHVGNKAEIIADSARRLGCDRIVMSTARKNSLTRMIQDSVTNKVLELATVPVEVIAGDAVSKLERYGIPAGIGAALALLLLAEE